MLTQHHQITIVKAQAAKVWFKIDFKPPLRSKTCFHRNQICLIKFQILNQTLAKIFAVNEGSIDDVRKTSNQLKPCPILICKNP